jgi:hypothetical protein
MLVSTPQTSLPGTRTRKLVLAACALALIAACADTDPVPLDGSTSAAAGRDARAAEGPDADHVPDPADEPDDPTPALDAGGSEQDSDDAGLVEAGEEPDADATGEDAGTDPLDADATGGDAGQSDAAQPPAPDASTEDAQTDAATPDAGGCPAAQPADACGVCGGDGSSCRHPLTGRYAARTQFYALQHASIAGTELDLVSNGSVLSVVDISPAGVATERYCFLELVSSGSLFVWSPPATVEEIPATSVALEQRGDRFVRPLAMHRAYFGWSAQGAPADCVTGQTHASGCLCGAADALPSDEDDCRVRDIDGDGAPGGSMYLDGEQPTDPSTASTQLKLNVVALLNLEWSLHPPNGSQIIGDIAGGLDQAVLSLEGELSADVEDLDNQMCDSRLGHVELIRGDSFTCESILAGRAEDAVGYGLFDPVLDESTPTIEVCDATPGG